ncbi:MAG: serine hydrolase, partial [Janthinobacterium lividum]
MKVFLLASLIGLAAAAPGQEADKLAPPTAPSAAGAPVRAAPVIGPETSTTHPLSKMDVDSWLDGYMPYALHADDIAGAVVAVVKNGHVLTERGYGYADVAKHVSVDPDRTLFRIGSVSKLVTWTAVMQLV